MAFMHSYLLTNCIGGSNCLKAEDGMVNFRPTDCGHAAISIVTKANKLSFC